MNKNEQLGNYEAQKDQPKELQDALGGLAVTGDTLDLVYLRGIQLNQKVGETALKTLSRKDLVKAA